MTVAAILICAPMARADDQHEVVCGPDCWLPALFNNGGWVEPGSIGAEGNIHGGDGGTCDLDEAFRCIGPNNIDINPCGGYGCYGDEGTGQTCFMEGWIIICDAVYYFQGDDPFADPPANNPPDWDQTANCEDYWSGVNSDPWPGGCRMF